MNKTHYILVMVLLGGALLITSFFAPEANKPAQQPQANTVTTPATQPAAMPVAAPRNSVDLLNAELLDMKDKPHRLKEWKGKILVLNFWATWCGPCRIEIPGFNSVQKKYADQNVQFLGIGYDDKEAITQFMKVVPIDYPVLYGSDEVMDLSIEFGNMQSILPFTVFIDPTGKVFDIAEGAISEQAVESILQQVIQRTPDSVNLLRTGG